MIVDIENGKHVHIDWKIKLQYIMKKQYLDSDRCDLALGFDYFFFIFVKHFGIFLGLDEFFNEQLAMIVSQDTPYLQIFNDE